jgi:hypothetical protein
VSPRAARLSGPRLWAGAALLVMAILAGVGTMGVLLAPGSWMLHSATMVVLLAASVTSLRQLLRSTFLPTAWGTLIAVLAVAAAYGGVGPGLSIPQPTTETLDRLQALVGSGVQGIVDGVVPVTTTRGLDLLVVAGAVASYLLADLIVLGLGRAGLGGVVIAALWMPVVFLERRPSLWLLAIGGVSFLLLLALTHRRQLHRSAGEEATTVTVVAAGITGLALLLATGAAALPFYDSVRIPSAWGGQSPSDSPLQVSTDLDMRADLAQRSDRPLLRYTTDGPTLGPLRMYTMSLFDGQEWKRGSNPSGLRTATGRLWPRDEAEGTTGDSMEVRVTVLGLSQDHLPIPTDPRTVDADGTWQYDDRRDEVVGANTNTRGLNYVLQVEPRRLTADVLRQDRAGRPPGIAQYLQLPASEFENEIRALAREVTTDATDDYGRALALQMYFRDLQLFKYDTRVPPPQTGDAVWDFLNERSGYCVQYATAMTIMARSIGLPARMAVGFLPGRRDPSVPRTWEVTARLAHTWPEIYFEDAGWVRFEPTPARQSGPPPTYADPFLGVAMPMPDEFPTGAGQTADPGQQQGSGGGGTPGYVTIGGTEVPIPVVAGIATLLAIGGGAGLGLWLRRRRWAAEPRGPDEWWTRLRQLMEIHGVGWSDATTPRQAAALVRDRYPADADTADARVALDALVAAVENERYAPMLEPRSPEDLRAWVIAAELPLAPDPAAVDGRLHTPSR